MTLLLALSPPASAQSRLLDEFEEISGWKGIPSDGVRMSLANGPGTTGKALVMDFEFYAGSGYAIAQKKFSLDLPKNYKFTFFLKGDTPANNFEFKLLDSLDNVFWIKKLNVTYPPDWMKQTIRKRHITFAWGPSGGGEIRQVDRIEFVVSAGTGGKGRISIDDFRVETLPDSIPPGVVPKVEVSSSSTPGLPRISMNGDTLGRWQSGGTGDREWVLIDFGRSREFGGLVIDWHSEDYAGAYDVLLSDDGKEWSTAYSVSRGNGGRDYIFMEDAEARFLKLGLRKSSRGKGYSIQSAVVKASVFSSSPNEFFMAIANDAPRGFYPKYFSRVEAYWTIIGASGDDSEALINENGMVEADKMTFSLEPFLYVDDQLITWDDADCSQGLEKEYLPIPWVRWKSKRQPLHLTVKAFAVGDAGASVLVVGYKVRNTGTRRTDGKLFVTLRPFQVNTPWQVLNIVGGCSRIDSISYDGSEVRVDHKRVLPLEHPDAFGATSFDEGDITEYVRKGQVPANTHIGDHFGFGSAALEYGFDLPAGHSKEIFVAVPFHDASLGLSPNQSAGRMKSKVNRLLGKTIRFWESKLENVQIRLPSAARPIVNTLKSNLAYILINRDGPGIQPGSRSYERSWIRDGSLTSTALLETGNRDEVRQFIDWYASHQYESGKIPCVADNRGADPVPEHDSHGQFIYVVLQYFRHTHDTTWLRSKLPNVVKTVRYIQSLRAERMTDMYRYGTADERACYGLVPESISHEGYSDKARHSYWDGFFVLRGLKDATTIATVLGEWELEAEWAAERDDFQRDFYSSMRMTMANHDISYIPGCVELGDFDATSTAIGVVPCGELGNIPEPQLRNTFDKYYDFFLGRKGGTLNWNNYTPYEVRIIGAFVYMDRKDRAKDLLDFFMADRRPPAWNHWAEVVWRDPETPRFIGDMPHTWVGSDFIRSMVSMFVLERERDSTHVLAAGIPDAWVTDANGVQVEGLQTPYGAVNYRISMNKSVATVQVSGTFDAIRHKLVFRSPLSRAPRSVRVDGKEAPSSASGEVVVRHLPSKIVFSY